jgi:hypothetical protein
MKGRLGNARTPDFLNLFILFHHDLEVIIVIHRILYFQIFSGIYTFIYILLLLQMFIACHSRNFGFMYSIFIYEFLWRKPL